MVIIKIATDTNNWVIYDVARSPYNPADDALYPDNNVVEAVAGGVDFVSNGFKIRSNAGDINSTGNTLIYMTFGQTLVGTNNVPCTAR